ncbi:MAG: hypothetical protein M0R39_16295 [Prolixibacteraceae bacterium]|nr:hypothetical protein [Prolixibacteraceae bacterium]
MISLAKDLQKVKSNIEEFGEITIRVLQYLPNVLSSHEKKNDYTIHTSQIAGTTKYIRPINHKLFIYNAQDFVHSFDELKNNLGKVKLELKINGNEKDCIDKTLYTIQERFVGHPQKVIGIFLNDVQRKENDNISFTLVSGLFMVYSKFLTKLEGIYYLDPPPNATKKPYSDYMNRFSELISGDFRTLLTS